MDQQQDNYVQKYGLIILHGQESDNLQYNTVGRWNDGMIIPPSDGPMFIFIDWE